MEPVVPSFIPCLPFVFPPRIRLECASFAPNFYAYNHQNMSDKLVIFTQYQGPIVNQCVFLTYILHKEDVFYVIPMIYKKFY